MKRIFVLFLMLGAVIASQADTALIVHQKSGGTVEYAFSEKPVVTYSDGYLVITFTDALVKYPLSNMLKFTFGEVSDQVTRITPPKETAPQPTYIYNISGILMRTLEPTDDGTTPATLDGLPTGTYIIKNGNTTYKVSKR